MLCGKYRPDVRILFMISAFSTPQEQNFSFSTFYVQSSLNYFVLKKMYCRKSLLQEKPNFNSGTLRGGGSHDELIIYLPRYFIISQKLRTLSNISNTGSILQYKSSHICSFFWSYLVDTKMCLAPCLSWTNLNSLDLALDNMCRLHFSPSVFVLTSRMSSYSQL